MDEYCAFKTASVSFDEECPLPGNLYKEKYFINGVWVPVIKKDQNDYYYYTTKDEDYGKLFEEVRNGNSSRCLIFGSDLESGPKPVDCSVPRHHMCIYEPNHFLYRCPENCVPAGLGSSKCYCKYNNLNGHYKNVATPQFYYQNVAIKKLANTDDCLIRNKTTKKLMGVNIKGFVPNNNFSWRINEVEPLSVPKSVLTLQFISRKHELHLSVIEPEGLYKIDGKYKITCFLDGYPVRKLDIKRKRKSKYKEMLFHIEIEDYAGEYWCVGFQLPSLKRVESNKVVAYKQNVGYEYALKVVADTKGIETVTQTHKARLMRILKFNNATKSGSYLLHVSTSKRNNIFEDYYRTKRRFESIRNISLIYFRSSKNCFPEDTLISNRNLQWELTKIGEVAISKGMCIKTNGIPVTRKCSGNFLFGAYWDAVRGSCSNDYVFSHLTELMYSYTINNKTLNKQEIENVTELIKSADNLTSYDVYLISNLIEKVQPENTTELFFETIHDIMKTDRTYLNLSQIILNSTDRILNAIDNYLNKNSYTYISKGTYFLLQKTNLILQISYPFVDNVKGIALYGKTNETFDKYNITNVTDETIPEITNTNLQIATLIPEDILKELSQNLTTSEKTKLQLIITIFQNDTLFNSANFSQKTNGKVISVLMPQYDEIIDDSIPLYLNSDSDGSDCAFWDYGGDWEGKNGSWSNVGEIFYETIENTSIVHCEFNHLTHFALLITSEKITAIDEEGNLYWYEAEYDHDLMLNIITYVGCALSLFGIVGIILTAFLFEKWRGKIGSKILLQISVAIAIEIVVTQLAGMDMWKAESSQITCACVGVVLHYIILTKFCWMLIAAYFQHHRFVRVLNPIPSNVLLKSSLLAWAVPLIPVMGVFLISPHDYVAGARIFCYPKDLSLYIGIFLPLLIIIIANLTIFFLIMRNVTNRDVQGKSKHNLQKQQIFLGILLFFLLGLPWWFGILGEFTTTPWIRILFLYLFCSFATIQGFVLFVFYVLLDKETRLLYKYKYCGGIFSDKRRTVSTAMMNVK